MAELKDKLVNLEDLKVVNDDLLGKCSDLKSAINTIFYSYTDIESGTISSTTGKDSASTKYLRTGYIHIDTFSKMVSAGVANIKWFAYDAEKTFIGAPGWIASAQTLTKEQCKTRFENVAYIRFIMQSKENVDITPEDYYSMGFDILISILISNKIKIDDINSYLAELSQNVSENTTRIDDIYSTTIGEYNATDVQQGSLNSTGVEVDSTKYIRTGFIDIDTFISMASNGTYNIRPYFYTSDNTFIQYGAWRTASSTLTRDDVKNAYPNTGKIRFIIQAKQTVDLTPADYDNTGITILIDQIHDINRIIDNSIEAGTQSIYSNLGYLGVKNASTLPDYWINYMPAKLAEIQSNVEATDIHGDSFIFLTDYHYDGKNGSAAVPVGNVGYSHFLIKHIMENTSIKRFVFGGDVFNGSASKDTAINYMRVVSERFHNMDMYGIRGNHEYNLNDGGSASVMLHDDIFYSLFIKDVEDKIVANDLDYYNDNLQQKIRYIFMDSRYEQDTEDAGIITEAQINWMKARISELPTGWTVVVFTHQYFQSLSQQPETPTPENPPKYRAAGTMIKNALVSLRGNINAAIAAVISGHIHADYSYTGNGFAEICTTTDSCQAHNQGFVIDTTNELAFDVFSINTNTKTINAIRIGHGNDRSWLYS